MANLGQPTIDLISGSQNSPSRLYSLDELIPEHKELTEYLDSTRAERAAYSGVLERGKRLTSLQGSLGVKNPVTGKTLQQYWDGITSGKEMHRWNKEEALVTAADEFVTDIYKRDIKKIGEIFKGRRPGVFETAMFNPENRRSPNLKQVAWDVAQGKVDPFKGKMDPYELAWWMQNYDVERNNPKATPRDLADLTLKQFQKLIVPSSPLTQRMPLSRVLEYAQEGNPINDAVLFDKNLYTTGNSADQQGRLGQSWAGSEGWGLMKGLDNGTGRFMPLFRPRVGFNTSNALLRDSLLVNSDFTNLLTDANIVESARLYAGQKIAQQHILGDTSYALGDTPEAISGDWLARQANPDAPLLGTLPSRDDAQTMVHSGTLGGYPATPFSSYRAAGSVELQGALESGKLIQESPSYFITKDGQVASRPDYAGPRYFNNGENLWNYTVNTSPGGSYNVNDTPVVWEVIAGANEQRYPTSQIKVGNVETGLAGLITKAANYSFPDANKGLEFALRAGGSQELVNDVNSRFVGGMATNPIPLQQQIAGNFTTLTSPVNPFNGETFGIQLHTGVHTGVPFNTAGFNAYVDLKGIQKQVERHSGPFNQSIYALGDEGQLQVGALEVDSIGTVGIKPGTLGLSRATQRYKNVVDVLTHRTIGTPDEQIMANLIASSGENVEFKNLWEYKLDTPVNWASIGQFQDSSSPVWALPEVAGGGGRYNATRNQWSTGFEIGPNAGIPSRAFVPVDPSDPTKGWKIAYSNFASHGLGELDTPLTPSTALPYIEEALGRTPSPSWMTVASKGQFAENFGKTLGWVRDQKKLVEREAYDWTRLGKEEFIRRFEGGDFGSIHSPYMNSNRSFETPEKSIQFLQQGNEASFSLNRPLPDSIKKVLTSHLPNTHIATRFQTWDQFEGLLESMTPGRTGILHSSQFPELTEKQLTRIVTDFQQLLATEKYRDGVRTSPFTLNLRAHDSRPPSYRNKTEGMTQTEYEMGLAASVRQGSILSKADFAGYSPMSPKASQLRGKEFGSGSSPSNQFFTDAQKQHLARVAATYPDGKIPPGVSAGYTRFALTNKVVDSFVNIAKGTMPSEQAVQFARMLENPASAEQVTVAVSRFAQAWPNLTDEGKEIVKQMAKAKLGELASGFLQKAGTAAAVLTAPFDARNRQKHKMDALEKEIEGMNRRGESLNMTEGEIFALAEMNAVISGLENVPNFVTFGEYDRLKGYREESLPSMIYSGLKSGLREFGKYNMNPLVMRGSAKAKKDKDKKSSSEALNELTK
jgi:hypothetical protein